MNFGDIIIIIHLQNLGKICVTCQVNQFVNDANKDDLEGMESSLEKALLLLLVIVVLKHVVVVGVVVVVHRAVGVDQKEGGGRRGGEGDRGRSDWCENEGYVGADVVLGVVYFYVKSTLLMVLMTLVMTTTLTRARSRMVMKECWNFPRLVSRWILIFFQDKDFSHLVF